MNISLVNKGRRKIWSVLVRHSRKKWYYPFLYRSYWHFLFHRNCKSYADLPHYYSAQPNPGAGIGHQIANWIAGYWFANKFGLKFAHIPFVNKEWDDILGFGSDEILVSDLITKGCKVRRLPLFDEDNENEVRIQMDIINSYFEENVVFIAEQDQYYRDQYGLMDILNEKFYSASARKIDRLIFEKNHFNIAIHVRRGDIMTGTNNPIFSKRVLNNQYYYNVLKEALCLIETTKEIHIYFFSQGKPEDFPEFKDIKNLHWCFDMSAQQSFLHMVYADLLITSKSSFSYKPALLNKGIKVCPKNFWHGYPDSKDWILCDDNGRILPTSN